MDFNLPSQPVIIVSSEIWRSNSVEAQWNIKLEIGDRDKNNRKNVILRCSKCSEQRRCICYECFDSFVGDYKLIQCILPSWSNPKLIASTSYLPSPDFTQCLCVPQDQRTLVICAHTVFPSKSSRESEVYISSWYCKVILCIYSSSPNHYSYPEQVPRSRLSQIYA